MGSVFKRGTGSKYYIQWYDHEGKRRTECTDQTDKAAARRILNKRETDAALKRTGVVDAALEGIVEQSRKTIEEHLVNFANKMRTAGDTDKHINEVLKFIRIVAKHLKWKRVDQITGDGLNQFVADLRVGEVEDEEGNEKASSARTVQKYLTALKSFTKWLASHQKLPRDPLAAISKPNPETDRRKERRMMLPAEWEWLKAASEGGRDFRGMTGHERRLLYETALQTALRSNELRSLTRGSFHMKEKQPCVLCRAKATKNSEMARQYLPHALAVELEAYIKTRPASGGIFPMPDPSNVVDMLRYDLTEARKLWLESISSPDERSEAEKSDFLLATNYDGEVLDFHALRHTCGAWLSRAGSPPQEVQRIMRHSSITLTMDTYGHLFPGQEATASQRMAELLEEAGALHLAQQLERETAQSGASGRDEEKIGIIKKESRNPFVDAALGEKSQEILSSEDRTRTGDLRLMKPPL